MNEERTPLISPELVARLVDVLAHVVVDRAEQIQEEKRKALPQDPPLEETLSQMLQSADWFRYMLTDVIDETDLGIYVNAAIKKRDFSNEINAALVEHDFSDAVRDCIEQRVVLRVT
jgi:hypothetical protein